MTSPILVIAPESSGHQWVSKLIRAHPDAPKVVNGSYPSDWMPITHMPDYTARTDIEHVVVCVRYWPFTLMSQREHGYLEGRPEKMVSDETIVKAIAREFTSRTVHWCAYAIMVGPFGRLYFSSILGALGLDPDRFPWDQFKPVDGNAKYLAKNSD